jgi:hypothetical protein
MAGGCATKAPAEFVVPTKSKISQTLKDQSASPERYRIALRGMAIPGESLVGLRRSFADCHLTEILTYKLSLTSPWCQERRPSRHLECPKGSIKEWLHLITRDRKISGRFVIMPSTPISMRRSISGRESGVQT